MNNLQYKTIDELFLIYLEKDENQYLKSIIDSYNYSLEKRLEVIKIAQTSIIFRVFCIEYNIRFILSNIVPEIIKLFKKGEK